MEAHSKTNTPYGPVVQTLLLPTDDDDPIPWECCNPMALIYHLASISVAFSDIMVKSHTPGVPMRIVIYVDECQPGNPLRPEKSRCLQCIYFAFVEWPAWLLQRSGAWLNLGFIRTPLANTVRGGLSGLMSVLLQRFFSPASDKSILHGVTIDTRNGPLVVKAVFVGFLADDACHTHLSSCVGSSGIHVCATCTNVVHRLDADVLGDGLVTAACTDCAAFRPHTNDSIREVADTLAVLHATRSNTVLKQHQTRLGFKYAPHELLYEPSIRHIYRPVDHCLRDWMHIFLNGGIANTEVGLILHVAVSHGVSLDHVRAFFSEFTLPRKYGKIQTNWITENRLKDDSLSSFAIILLTIVTI